MQTDIQPAPASKKMIWTGRILSALPALMMLGMGVPALIHPSPEMLKGFSEQFGYPEHYFSRIIIVEIACVVLYLIPQTAVLGAILMTGYLGGATATHVRVQDPAFVMPVIVGIVVWLGLFLRDRRLRELLPLRGLPSK